MPQLAIDFNTASKINTDKLSRQNRIIYEYLESGETITTVSARDRFRVFNLHSRISDLRNVSQIQIYDRMIRIGDMNCKEYSLKPFL
jgi:hypothetical protein